jgi:hypothetical protein
MFASHAAARLGLKLELSQEGHIGVPAGQLLGGWERRRTWDV